MERTSRWEGPSKREIVAGLKLLPSQILTGLTAEQLRAYATVIRIEEISANLRTNNIVPTDRLRSPSPPPEYDSSGKRTNTREYRYRKKLENERHKLVTTAISTLPLYQPPPDYKKPAKTQEKLFIPVHEYPHINFIGQLIGPRGNTLRKMQEESGATIAIRGKGSVKDGKGHPQQQNMDDDLHCLISASNEEQMRHAIRLCNEVITKAVSTPEGQNNHKRDQLRELAVLNGTLRPDDDYTCNSCGEKGHRRNDCPKRESYIQSIVCRVCGMTGHFARDCKRNNPNFTQLGSNNAIPDREFDQLMRDLNGFPERNPVEEEPDLKRRLEEAPVEPEKRQRVLPTPPPGLLMVPGLPLPVPGMTRPPLPPGLKPPPPPSMSRPPPPPANVVKPLPPPSNEVKKPPPPPTK
ncbi:unnamed protein product [Kuraishia capsulata CBS 1993]|uniref:Branchpoint-bridging protein n=1 Tax=Kuraishia capsulata CBS 1993 TaxID=1382522 RepID=W6MXA6_9ASCO|nr:uncharacterized protein KUCA_T00004538001 [Kuraishia capsulata CBS 1993]CDK28555.1 unnamed protein product [Kuraishia capsulata CBS 1993]